MKSILTTTLAILVFGISASAKVTHTPPKLPEPRAFHFLQWDMSLSQDLMILSFINPKKADFHMKVYDVQGELVHEENLSEKNESKIGFDLSHLEEGEYRVILESDSIMLSNELVTLY